MKTVKYKGLTYDVPEGTKSMATDANGEVYAHPVKPYVQRDIWYASKRGVEQESTRVYPKDWKDSLVEIEE